MPIHILDAATVGRIAAGEVVERPCSVAKELVENSLDAGATSVTVEIRGGGIDYLRVTDNGCGIEPGQARLAFEIHATSKLQNADQLDDIRTLGFRGEALPSIAAVSHVELTTRAKNQDSGTKVNVDGGQNLRIQETGCPDGTTFVMRDLFYNIPVRRAFLKKPGYEGGLVSDVMARLMLGNPGVSMRFINNGSTVYHTYGDGKLRHAVFAVYGKETAEKMIELDAAEGGTRVFGLIGVGELAKPTRAHQMFFINGRSVRCGLLTKALEEVCRSRVTIGMFPMCALNLILPPNAIDVNVHPNKLEVRFRDEETTRITVEKLLSGAFEGERVLEIAKEAAPVKEIERISTVKEISLTDRKPKMPPVRETKPAATESAEKPKMPPLPVRPKTMSFVPELEIVTGKISVADAPAPKRVSLRETFEEEKPAMPFYRVAGVLFKTYILVETGDSLLLIDQHAAHERLQYEKLVKRLEEGTASQPLLTPLIVRVSAAEMALIEENAEALRSAGYEAEPFGESSVRVSAVPFVLGKAELKPMFMEMLGSLSDLKNATLETRRAEIMQMACKSAVKGGDALTDSEIRALIDEMMTTGAPPTCPHGRPVVKTIQRRELEKLFRRIQ